MYHSVVHHISMLTRRISVPTIWPVCSSFLRRSKLVGALIAGSLLLVMAVPAAPASAATWNIITNQWGNIAATAGPNVVYGNWAPPSQRAYVCVTVGLFGGIGSGGWHVALENYNGTLLYESPAWRQAATLCSPTYSGNPSVQGVVIVDDWISISDVTMKLHILS